MNRFDPRLVIAVSFALFAGSKFMNIAMTGDYVADRLCDRHPAPQEGEPP
jgi:DHA2 family multidrug resistance protein